MPRHRKRLRRMSQYVDEEAAVEDEDCGSDCNDNDSVGSLADFVVDDDVVEYESGASEGDEGEEEEQEEVALSVGPNARFVALLLGDSPARVLVTVDTATDQHILQTSDDPGRRQTVPGHLLEVLEKYPQHRIAARDDPIRTSLTGTTTASDAP